MTATPSPKGVEPKEPVPSALDEKLLHHEDRCKMSMTPARRGVTCTCERDRALVELVNLRTSLATLTAERDEAQKRAEVAEAENVRLTEFMKRAHGNLAAALIAPSAKLETDLEVAPTA